MGTNYALIDRLHCITSDCEALNRKVEDLRTSLLVPFVAVLFPVESYGPGKEPLDEAIMAHSPQSPRFRRG